MYFRDKIIIEYSYIIYSCINIKHTSCVVDSFDYENRRAIDSEIIDNENSETMTKIDDTSAEIRRSPKTGGGGGGRLDRNENEDWRYRAQTITASMVY